MKTRFKMLTPLLAVSLISLIGAGTAGAASSPTVRTAAPTSVRTSSAVLRAVIQPGGKRTFYRFEYGLTTSFGLSTTQKSIAPGTSPVSVAVKVTGLLPGSDYFFRIDALNTSGGAISTARRFKTAGNPPPNVATGPATVTSATTATVSGIVNPQHQATTYYFQYGPANAPVTVYSQTQPQPAPATTGPVSAVITGLTPATNFRYQLVAIHSDSPPAGGGFLTFDTFPLRPPVPRLNAATTPRRARHRPFEFVTAGLVTPPASSPRPVACSGNVSVRFKKGRKQVGFELAALRSNCTFTAFTQFARIPRNPHSHRPVRLTVLIHYRGNGYLAPANTRREKVTIG
ncbi:MAG: fibronectin type III domain-containing protein [Actinomycetota bacterium]|nr:fibronectin type III domain-containing protein [Actinomycetota bacterium]